MRAGGLLLATLRPDAEDHRDGLVEAWSKPPAGTLALLAHEGAALWANRRLAALRVPAVPGPLRAEALATAARGLRIDAAGRQVLVQLSGAGIAAIPIKGMARRILAGRWPLLDARSLGDIDLLLPPDQVDAGWQFLRGQGYQPAVADGEAGYRDHHHLVALVGPEGVAVELHRSASALLEPARAWERFWAGSESLSWQDLVVQVPAPTELVWHTISHAATDGVAGFRLRHWLDLVGLAQEGAPVDWEVIGTRIGSEPVQDGQSLGEVAPRVLRQWLGAGAMLMSGATADWQPLTDPVGLERLLDGRAAILASRWGQGRPSRRLLAEWTRDELDWPLETVVGSASVRARHRLKGLVARRASRLLARR
ncbi:MAG: nucleotidyltransferase family protein [Gemmatimonadota bacterium]|nr:nucleotidyltransferase family protein [Gemmatimonadota bacterium]